LMAGTGAGTGMELSVLMTGDVVRDGDGGGNKVLRDVDMEPARRCCTGVQGWGRG
jgi:hypothetical protein